MVIFHLLQVGLRLLPGLYVHPCHLELNAPLAFPLPALACPDVT